MSAEIMQPHMDVSEQTAQPLPEGAMQLADLILTDPAGGSLVISSDLTTEADGAMRFTTTNPTTGARFGVYIGISELTADPSVPAQTGTCVSAAPLPVATQQPKLIETLKFALQDALGFAELVESYSKPDVEMFKHELRNDSELAQRRINVALQAIEDVDVALPVAAPQDVKLEGAQVAKADYVLMPRTLTTDNGAKGALSGEFVESFPVACHECDGVGEVDDGYECKECKGEGQVEQHVMVEWDTIKHIYARAVALLAAPTTESVAAPELAQDKLDSLTRYGWSEAYIGDTSELVEDEAGTYVKFSDVQSAILATKGQDQKGGAA